MALPLAKIRKIRKIHTWRAHGMVIDPVIQGGSAPRPKYKGGFEKIPDALEIRVEILK